MKKFLLSVLSICMFLGLFGVASATTILNFDDVTNNLATLTSYGGLDWTKLQSQAGSMRVLRIMLNQQFQVIMLLSVIVAFWR